MCQEGSTPFALGHVWPCWMGAYPSVVASVPAVPTLPQGTVLSWVLAPDNEVASPVAGLKASLQALANLFSLCLGRLWP